MRTAVIGVAFALGLLSPLLAQQDDTIYKPGNGVSSPRLIRDVKPQYTPGAMRRGVNGAVLLRCVVDRMVCRHASKSSSHWTMNSTVLH